MHADGQIWSRALWDIRQALGHVRADTVILEAQFDFAGDDDAGSSPQRTVAAAQRLYGASVASPVAAAFEARGILSSASGRARRRAGYQPRVSSSSSGASAAAEMPPSARRGPAETRASIFGVVEVRRRLDDRLRPRRRIART